MPDTPGLSSGPAEAGSRHGLKAILTTRLIWLLWIGSIVLFVAIWMSPVSDGRTRLAGIALLSAIWLGFIALVWSHRILRFAALAFTALCGVFLILSGRSHHDTALLRDDFVAGMRRYTGVRYYWGGESPAGIDCSGLMQRGMIDGMFLRGILSVDQGLVRYAIWLWWHRCNAADLGRGRGATLRRFSTPSLNHVDPSSISPGDLAVAVSGVHVLGYLGGNLWIEADPTAGRVIIEHSAPNNNVWFNTPMNIVRWRILDSGPK